MIPRVKEHEPISIWHQNRFIDEFNRLSRILPPVLPLETRVALFELTSVLTYPADTGACPSATAKPIAYLPSADRYGYTDSFREQTIYHPMALRTGANYIGLPVMREDDRVWCVMNQQSGRWEILWLTPQTTWRGKLDAELEQGGSATVSIWIYNGSDADSGVDVTAYDWFLSAGQSLASDTVVTVEWFPDDGRFWLIGAEC